MIWSTFIHHLGDSVLHNSIDNVSVSCNPTYISSAPINIVLLQVENILRSKVAKYLVTRRGVHDAFWLPCRATGVEQKQQIFRFHFFGGAIVAHISDEIMIPTITAIDHRTINRMAVASFNHDDILHAVAIRHAFINNLFKLQHLSSAVATVRRDNHTRLTIEHAVTN